MLSSLLPLESRLEPGPAVQQAVALLSEPRRTLIVDPKAKRYQQIERKPLPHAPCVNSLMRINPTYVAYTTTLSVLPSSPRQRNHKGGTTTLTTRRTIPLLFHSPWPWHACFPEMALCAHAHRG
jgi:hypothetical protein